MTATATATKTTKTAPTTTPEDNKEDRFGSRGPIYLAVNAVLTTTPKTMATILAESGVELPQYGHLGDLVKKGLVIKTKEGYALPAAPKAKKGKGKKAK